MFHRVSSIAVSSCTWNVFICWEGIIFSDSKFHLEAIFERLKEFDDICLIDTQSHFWEEPRCCRRSSTTILNFLPRFGLITTDLSTVWEHTPLTHLFNSCRLSFLDQGVRIQVHQWNQPGIRNHLPWQPGRRQTPLPKKMRRILPVAVVLRQKMAARAWNWYQRSGLNKWNTNFRLEHSVRKTGLPFQTFRCSREFCTGTTRKVVYHLLSNRNFWKIFVNGKQPLITPCVPFYLSLVTTPRVALLYRLLGYGYNSWRQRMKGFILILVWCLENGWKDLRP